MADHQKERTPDAVLTRIGQVVMLHRGGDRDEARDRFLGLWAEIGEDGDALHRCTLAHYLADTQEDPADELAWDLRALSAAEELTDGRVTEHQRWLAVRALYPSLHLNLAADYANLDRVEAARSHLRLAYETVGTLGEDSYGDGIRAAMNRLDARLNGEDVTGRGGEPPGPPGQHT